MDSKKSQKASSKIKNAKFVKKILENDYYHPDITTDIKGAEICAATKNIYATIIGAAVGQSNSYLSAVEKNKYHFNAASALFEQSLREMLIIIKKYNGLASTVMGPAGAGDLYVSAKGSFFCPTILNNSDPTSSINSAPSIVIPFICG